MLLHVSPVWSSLRGTVSVQGQAVVLASTTHRRQSCCRSEVLASSRIADLVDTSSGEALMVASPVSCPLSWVVLFPRTGGVCNRSVVLSSTTYRRQSSCRSEVLTSSRIADCLDFVGAFQGSLGRWVTPSLRGPSWGSLGVSSHA